MNQWVTSGYSLAMGVVMPLTAFLITRFPTIKLYLTGIGSFIAGLLLGIFAENFALMMAVGSMILLFISILGTKGRSYITRFGS